MASLWLSLYFSHVFCSSAAYYTESSSVLAFFLLVSSLLSGLLLDSLPLFTHRQLHLSVTIQYSLVKALACPPISDVHSLKRSPTYPSPVFSRQSIHLRYSLVEVLTRPSVSGIRSSFCFDFAYVPISSVRSSKRSLAHPSSAFARPRCTPLSGQIHTRTSSLHRPSTATLLIVLVRNLTQQVRKRRRRNHPRYNRTMSSALPPYHLSYIASDRLPPLSVPRCPRPPPPECHSGS